MERDQPPSRLLEACLAFVPELTGEVEAGRIGLFGDAARTLWASLARHFPRARVEPLDALEPGWAVLAFDLIVTIDALAGRVDAEALLCAIRNALRPSGAYLLIDHTTPALALAARAGFARIRTLAVPGRVDAFLLQR